jgi:5-dehydro-2-deoxygluconokinase
VSSHLDLITIGRVSVDLYGQQIGTRLEDVATFAKAVGGCPANVAIGAARLGLRAALITRVGDEPMGRFVLEQLARERVATRGVRVDPQRLTSLVLLSVRDAQTFPLTFYRENCADSALCEDDIDEEFVASAQAILVTGTHFSLAAAARAQRKAIDIARRHGRTVVLDIDYRPNLWGIGGHGAGESRYARAARVTQALAPVLPECDLIVGTEEEMHIAAGIEETLAAIRHLRSLTAAVLVCKRGVRGCVVFAGEIPGALEDGLVAPGLDIEIYNVLGAGDAFLAGFLSGYLRGEPHALSARRANACGALAVSRLLCSSEFPTRAELDYFLAHGSSHAALREDPRLNHLHRVTTRRPQPHTLHVLALDPGTPLAELTGSAGAARQRLEHFGRLAVDAVARVAADREGFGVKLAATPGAAALQASLRSPLWVARDVHPRRARPHEVASDSLALQLSEWPIAITAHYRCEVQPGDSRGLGEAQEREVRNVAAVCRAQGRELLLEIATGAAGAARSDDATARVLAHIYALDVRPDWWLLEGQPNTQSWQDCVRVITANDGYCRGILLGLPTASEAAAALDAAAAVPLVRGFVAGGSIVGGAAAAWLAGQLSDEAALAAVAERFAALAGAWSDARDRRHDRPQRSAN